MDRITAPEGTCLYADAGKQIYRSGDAVQRCIGSVGKTYLRICREGSCSHVQCLRTEFPEGITPKTVLNAMEAEHLIVQKGGFILHASFIRLGDKAVLFTAPSGTGKSTQAELWCRFCGAELINGDRAAVMTEGGKVFACGIPFSGSSGVAKAAKLPLAAVVYLSQNSSVFIEELKGFRAFRKIWEGCSVNIWDRQDVSTCSQTVLNMLETVPVYHLSCTPDKTAVDVLMSKLSLGGCL